jgi:hypothetical protein
MKRMDSKERLNCQSRKAEFKMIKKRKRRKKRVKKISFQMLTRNLKIWWVTQLGFKRFLSWARKKTIIGRKYKRSIRVIMSKIYLIKPFKCHSMIIKIIMKKKFWIKSCKNRKRKLKIKFNLNKKMMSF